MGRAEFDALVARLDAYAASKPGAYKARVVAMALLGYGYLAAMVALLLALLAATAASVIYLKALGVKLLLVLGPFVWVVARSLWVEVKPPLGVPVGRRDAPALFERIERIRRALGAPRFHRVVVNDEFNAAVVQVPLLGLFGWHRNYLLLGLPLMKSLTPEQLDAVLAHEFGHLAGGHARFGNWLYRLRMAWMQLEHELERANSAGALLFRPFLAWYAPRFSAYAFPLARKNEYEADAVSARLTSTRAAASALTGVSVIGAYLGERYWPSIHGRAEHEPQPAFAPFASFGGLRDALAPEDAQRWLARALEQRTTSDDTHPSLADRLRAMGAEPELSIPADGQSADQLLGPVRDAIVAHLDERWQNMVSHDWRERYEQVQRARARLAELDVLADAGPLEPDMAIERACIAYEIPERKAAATDALRALAAEHPEHAVALFALAVRLLGEDDASGVAPMERAIALDSDLAAAGHEALRNFHWRRGDRETAEAANAMLEERRREEYRAHVERTEIKLSDRYLAHDLGPDEVAALAAALQREGVRRAWLVRKVVRHETHRPLYVLAFRKTPWWRSHSAERSRLVTERIARELELPKDTMVICVEGDNYRFGRKFRWMRRTRIV